MQKLVLVVLLLFSGYGTACDEAASDVLPESELLKAEFAKDAISIMQVKVESVKEKKEIADDGSIASIQLEDHLKTLKVAKGKVPPQIVFKHPISDLDNSCGQRGFRLKVGDTVILRCDQETFDTCYPVHDDNHSDVDFFSVLKASANAKRLGNSEFDTETAKGEPDQALLHVFSFYSDDRSRMEARNIEKGRALARLKLFGDAFAAMRRYVGSDNKYAPITSYNSFCYYLQVSSFKGETITQRAHFFDEVVDEFKKQKRTAELKKLMTTDPDLAPVRKTSWFQARLKSL